MLNEIEVGLICLSESKKFKEVYEEYFTALKYFAMRYVKDEEVACDLLQDVFVKLWEKGDRFENEMQLKTYLYRVVRNHCLTYIRDAQRKEKRMGGMPWNCSCSDECGGLWRRGEQRTGTGEGE